MNINSLITSFAPLTLAVAPSSRPARESQVSMPLGDVGRDLFTKGGDAQANAVPAVYTRAAASGLALRQANSTIGQASLSADSSAMPDKVEPRDGASGGVSSAAESAGALETDDVGRQEAIGSHKPNGDPFSASEKEVISKLQKIDQTVRSHEMAHLAAAGGYAKGGASYSYQSGPDGRKYAVGGEVRIDTSPASTPEATMAKMQAVRRAALAPADPSGQDQLVAAQATVQIAKAAQELVQLAGQEQIVDHQPGQVAESPVDDNSDATPGEIYSQVHNVVTKPSHSFLNASLRAYRAVPPRLVVW